MARIPYPTDAQMSEAARDLLSRRGSLNVNRMMGYSEGVVSAYVNFGFFMLRKSKLNAALRELAILRIGVLYDCAYEWHHHESYARNVGLWEKAIAAARSGDPTGLTEQEATVLAFATETKAGKVSKEVFDRARTFLTNEELVELAMAAGLYAMTATFLNTFEIDIDEGPSLGDKVKLS